MKRKWLGLVCVCVLVFPVLSCAAGQQLVAVAVTPGSVVFEGVGAQVQFTAIGTYVHPPATKDITDQVTWSIDVKFLATITSTGLATATNVCGSGNVIATAVNVANAPPGTVMRGTASIAGIDNGKPQCMP